MTEPVASVPPAATPATSHRIRAISYPTNDSFQNFAARVGIGTDNQNSFSQYGFNPITRNRLQMEWAYRGSWIAGRVVDCIAEDMTREGVEITTDDTPDQMQELDKEAQRLQIWPSMCETIKWARLYGGALGFLMIDGQNHSTPLNLDSVDKGKFKGVLPLDRWMVQPTLSDLIEEFGPKLGKPKYYDLLPDTGTGLKAQRIHHSRMIRIEGVRLPYWQRITENYWGQSVLERLWDRMVNFDSTTQGSAQLVYKAHLRTYGVDGLRDIIAQGGKAMEGLAKQIEMIRRFQSNEGITLMDSKDKFETHQYGFSGLADLLDKYGEQLAGAAETPLARLFGQAPGGLNADGDSHIRNYYDGISNKQEAELREGAELTTGLLYRSTFGRPPPKVFAVAFMPLWQTSASEKATIANTLTTAIVGAFDSQLISRATGMRELKQMSKETGVWSNVDDKDIKAAEADPAPSPEALGLEIPQPDVGPQAPGQKPGENSPGAKGIRAVA